MEVEGMEVEGMKSDGMKSEDREDKVKVERRGSVAVVTVDNPPMNVLGGEVAKGLSKVFERLRDDGETVAVVLGGAGDRAFMAGADIREFPAALGNPGRAFNLAQGLHALMNAVDRFPKPTIAALHGFVLGGGMELALACDLRVCDEDTKLGLPEIKLGIFPGAGGTQRLPRLIGEARAKEIMYLGEPVTAQQAHAMGLVNRVAPPGKSLELAVELASAIAKHSLPALSRIKRAVDGGLERPLEDALQLEARLFDEVFQTEDSREGVSSFLEKRTAVFRHR